MVEGRGSKNYSKLFSNYFLTSSTQKFTGSCLLEFPVPLFAAFGIFWFVKKFYIPTDSPGVLSLKATSPDNVASRLHSNLVDT